MSLRSFTAVLVALIATSMAAAQPLAQRVPDDAWLYVGWAGVDAMGDGYATSKLKAVIDATQLVQLIEQSLPKLAAAMREDDPQAKETLATMSVIASATWRNPTALFMTQTVRPTNHGEPMPCLAVLWKAGVEAGELKARLDAAIAKAPPAAGEPPVRTLVSGDVVCLALGYAQDDAVLAEVGGVKADSIAQNAAFKAAMAATGPDAAAVAYADVPGLLKMIDAMVATKDAADAKTRWPLIRAALGLDSIRGAVWSARFDQRDWVASLFVDAPAPRRGLIAALMDGAALDRDVLRLAPRTATWLNAFTFDAPSGLAMLRDLLAQIDPQIRADFEEALAKGSAAIGIDLEADLIAALGKTWMLYSDPAVTGFGGLGVCLVHPLRDAPKVEAVLVKLEALANQTLATNAEGGMHFRLQTVQQGDVTIHSLQFPMFAPSWAVSEGNLYVGLFPQAVSTAGFYARDGKNTILDNPKFTQLLNENGPPEGGQLAALSFVDLPQTASAAYQTYLMVTQMVTGMMSAQGGDAPVMLLPPLSAIMPHLSPAGSFAWVDPSGYHQRGRTPFPGAGLLSPEGSMNGLSLPMAVGIMLPALGAARRTARQMQANTQARGIHQAQVIYAQGHDTKFANDIGMLIEGNYFTAQYALSPVEGQETPADFGQRPMAQQKQWLRENAAYILVPDLTDDYDTNKIEVFGDPDMFGGDGIPVAYNDNHANWETDIAAIRAALLKQTGKTMEELIVRQREFKE